MTVPAGNLLAPAPDAAAPDGAAPDGAAPAESAQMGRGTLGRRLVLQVVALVAIVAVALSALTTIAIRNLLVTQLDQQIQSAGQRRLPPSNSDAPGASLNRAGQAFDTIYLAYADTGQSGGAILREDGPSPVDSGLIAQIQTTAEHDDRWTATLPGLGRYRLGVSHYTDGYVVVGKPMAETDTLVLGLVGLEAILALVAMGGAALAARALVARSLRPLNRLATTATQVSELELGRGEVALAVRVADHDADPRNEVGRVGQAFNHMLSNVDGALAARQASESKLRQFVADASHELRNPLAAIRGYAELTRRSRAEITPDAAFAMSRVESEADRMSRLVEDMLLLARLDSGPNLDLGPTDLTETVVNATSDARVAGPDHRWSLDIPDHPIVVQADQHRVHQVVANLLANARTHTPPGTSVQAGLRTDGARAVISVTDDGPGVPVDIQGRVFERFTRADTSRSRAVGDDGSGSTGLGLAIVAAVVDAHRGDVWVESRPGRTAFHIALPLPGEAADPPP